MSHFYHLSHLSYLSHLFLSLPPPLHLSLSQGDQQLQVSQGFKCGLWYCQFEDGTKGIIATCHGTELAL